MRVSVSLCQLCSSPTKNKCTDSVSAVLQSAKAIHSFSAITQRNPGQGVGLSQDGATDCVELSLNVCLFELFIMLMTMLKLGTGNQTRTLEVT